MEKYFVAKLEEANGEPLLTKLVDVQFARRPPTFGTLHLTQLTTLGSNTQQWLRLNTLNLASDQSAQFALMREINLSAALLEVTNDKAASVINFNTLNEQLLLEVSHSITSLERLLSSCFVLTQSGDLCVISLIDSFVQLVACAQGGKQSARSGEHFLDFKLFIRRQEDVLDHQVASKSELALEVHLLSEQTYFNYILRVKNSKLDCDIQLVNKYSVQDGNLINRSRRFTQFWIIERRAPHERLILIKLNDNSKRFVKNGKCLHSFDGSESSCYENDILALAANEEEETILFEYFNDKLVAHSLLITDHHERTSSNEDTRVEQHLLVANEKSSDPDGLLPRSPSFELEQCWSYDLTQIDGIRSKLLDETEERNETSGTRSRLNGCLCPLWFAETRAPSSSSRLGSPQDAEFISGTSRGWPKFLVVASLSHLLLFSFEHEQALPFSIVYDRAFLGLSESGAESSERLQQPASGGKSIDLRLKPKLLFNFRLIGQSPSDALMNLLFITQNIHLSQLRQFNQLGILVGLTSEHHLLALKLSSTAVVKHRDNLYQQTLLSSLRQPSLLSDEIERIELLNSKLLDRLAALEAGHLDPKQTRSGAGGEIDSLIRAHLQPDPIIGSLYKLQFTWPKVESLSRIVVISPVHLRFLAGEEASQRVKSIKMSDAVQSDETLATLERATLFLLNTSESGQASEPSHPCSSDPIKAWSIVELDRGKSLSSLMGDPFVEESFTLPLFLLDGQQSEGQLQVYFVFSNLMPPDFDKRNSSVSAETHFRTIVGALKGDIKLPSKYIKCKVPIKPLHSYRAVDGIEEDTKKTSPTLVLEIGGPFSEQRMIEWINECLDIDLSKVQNLIRDRARSNNVAIDFWSNFSHCYLTMELTRGPEDHKQKRDCQVKITSDDFIALTLIEKHLFKRATGDSIQLKRLSGSSVTLSIENLRHLIARQHLNVDLYMRLARRHPSSSHSSQMGDARRMQQIDILLENLMTEARDLQSLPIGRELKQSNLWLEKSFRQDLERVVSSQAGHEQKEINQSHSQVAIFVDIICSYIIDALVDYDRLLHVSGCTAKSKLAMRSKLMSFIQHTELSESVKFAERILNDWAEIKRTYS